MRRQYHAHKIGHDTHIWDVHRLVELSKELLPFDLPIAQVSELESPFWFHDSSEKPTCKEIALHVKLIQETDLKYPIILAPDGHVMDGMHRVCKAWIRGEKTIKAVQFSTLPAPDYVNVALDELPYTEPW